MKNALVAALLVVVLAGCAGPSPAQARDEIASFTLNFIVTSELGGADYIKTNGQPWVNAPQHADLIVYGPLVNTNYGPDVDEKQPTRVWWYEDNKLIESDQKAEAISRYEEQYMQNPTSDSSVWGYYRFGIISIAPDGRQAEIYVGASTGPLSGYGFQYKLLRLPTGKWLIIGAEHTWQA